ncbi:MAG: hypothetical protein Ct9H300mP23_08610 [Nitrospinota bacterium]|nr:MAG: hypothetical protein Ct9H300mP23_08610 [Nitrospinota bacterium]
MSRSTVKGKLPRNRDGVRFKSLKKKIKKKILSKGDPKNLNVDVDFLEGVIPTAENIAIHIWNILEPKIKVDIARSKTFLI